MRMLRQAVSLSTWTVEGVRARPVGAITTVASITVAIAVLVALLSMGEGLRTLATTGARADRAVILSRGAPDASESIISREALERIGDAPGVRHDADGRPLVTGAITVSVYVENRNGERTTMFVMGLTNPYVYPEIRIVTGRAPRAGLHELAVSTAAARRMKALNIGDHIKIRGQKWTIVGKFDDAGSFFDQYLITDAETLISTIGRNSFEDAVVVLTSPAVLGRFRDAISNDPILMADVHSEITYREEDVAALRGFLDFVSYFIGAIMGAAAVCAAASGFYASVDARRREIATLRAIGFSGPPIMASILAEAVVLSLCAAVLGAIAARLAFDGRLVSTSDLIFPLAIGPREVAIGAAWALVIGIIGAMMPGIHACRDTVVAALRAS